jgi:putative ABC transport system permease protein
VLTVALAIGANTAIFSAVEAVLIRPLPMPNLDRVVSVGKFLTDDRSHTGLQAAEVFDLEKRHDLFDAVPGYRNINVNLTGTGDPQRMLPQSRRVDSSMSLPFGPTSAGSMTRRRQRAARLVSRC